MSSKKVSGEDIVKLMNENSHYLPQYLDGRMYLE